MKKIVNINQLKYNKDVIIIYYILDNTKFKPFLELLLELVENGEQFTDEEVRDEVATLLIAVRKCLSLSTHSSFATFLIIIFTCLKIKHALSIFSDTFLH